LASVALGELQPRKAGVEAALGDEAVMGALGHDAPALEDEDPVGLFTVASRCATIRVVRSSDRRATASCTSRSLSASSALVASSSSRIGASRRMARAMAMRCFCPPDSMTPRSPT
jgi:hypothetical protein